MLVKLNYFIRWNSEIVLLELHQNKISYGRIWLIDVIIREMIYMYILICKQIMNLYNRPINLLHMIYVMFVVIIVCLQITK